MKSTPFQTIKAAAVCVFAPLGPYGAPGLDFLHEMDDSYREEVRMFFEDRPAARESSAWRQHRCTVSCPPPTAG